MATKNNDGFNDLALKIGGAVAAYLIIIKPIISTFGASPEEKAAIESVDTSAPGKSPFRADFEPTVNRFNSFYNKGETGGMNINEFVHWQKQQWDDLDEKPLTWGDWASPFTGVEIIRDAFGFWRVHIFGNNTDIMSVFNTVPDKNAVSSMAMIMWYLYGIDMWTLLKEGGSTMWRGLSPSDLKFIVDRVNSLPDFKY